MCLVMIRCHITQISLTCDRPVESRVVCANSVSDGMEQYAYCLTAAVSSRISVFIPLSELEIVIDSCHRFT